MFTKLTETLSGELYFDNSDLHESIKHVYASDASEYQEKPLAVILPKTITDLLKCIDFANKHRVTLVPRAAGTSLAGQVVSHGIIVDISKYFTKIIDFDKDNKWICVEPGVIRDDLNAFLKPHGLLFGPETSTANRAMIGGMVGNNSCGLHSIVWGTTRDNILELKVLLSDGSTAIFKDLNPKEYSEKLNLNNLEGTIYRKIDEILINKENQEAIKEGFPKKTIKRRNSGYALDFLLDMIENLNENPFNLSKLIAGSEGTLCIIVEIKLKLIDLAPKFEGMVAIHTNSIKEALEANLIALNHECWASELVDDFILEFTKTNFEQRKNRFFIEGEPKAILMVEFFAEDENTFHKKCEELINDLNNKKLGYAYPILIGEKSKMAWDVRKAGLGLLRNLAGEAKPVNLIEDCAVDPIDLPSYINEIENLLHNKKVKYAVYAHAGAGELHVEPIINLKNANGLRLFREILNETANIVKSYKGSLSGEHGDGRLRGEFIPFMMGNKNYELFKEIKAVFDPIGIFNKGKITDTPPMDKFLRYNLESTPLDFTTVFDFSKQEGILRLTEKCSGSGDCRKTEITGGTMCPSFMATRSEKDTTRARANILRQFLSNDLSNKISENEVKEILDLCLSCKACKSECPSSVDISKMKAEFYQYYYDKNGIPLRSAIIGNFSQVMKIAAIMPRVYNYLIDNAFFRKTTNRLLGFHENRTMPKMATQTFYSWYKIDFKQEKKKKLVYIFCDEFTNYNDAHIGKKMVLLIKKLGYQVHIVENSESGRAYLSKGLLKKAQKIAIENVNKFKNLISENTPLIGIEPSAILTFRDEYIDLVPEALKNDAQNIAKNSFLFEEWFCKEIDNKNISKSQFSDKHQLIRLHGHCHQKSIASISPTKKALSFPSNYEVHMINSGCCGMAGSFGYEKEHFEISMKIGELVLFPEIRKTDDATIIAASGTSCRHQILDGTNKQSLHPVEILFDALQ